MNYAARRRVAAVLAALAAAGLTALSALALGGEAPDPETQGRAAVAPRRTVTREVDVRRVVHGPARTRTVIASVPAAAPAAEAPAPVRAAAPRTSARHHRPPAHHAPATHRPAAPAAGTGGDEPVASGGYRAFAAATAASAGGVQLARTGSGTALDGHAPDTADELGPLAAGLPAGRTAFGRALALTGGAQTTSSSPPAGPAANASGGAGSTAASAARTDAAGGCVVGAPISSADAHAATAAMGPFALTGARSATASQLDPDGTRRALVSRATVALPDVTAAGVVVRFLGPVALTVRAGGTPGSASAALGAVGRDLAAPLVEVDAAGQTVRYTAADVLDGGGRTLTLGGVTIVLGGAPHAWRGELSAPPLVSSDGRFASAAADVLSLRLPGGARIDLGHIEAAAAVPAGGVRCD